jgi:hypothetical protein
VAPPPDARPWRRDAVTIYFIAAQIVTALAFVIAWSKGGRPERLATAVLVVDYLQSATISRLAVPHAHAIATALEGVPTVVFLWLAFTCDRWWLLVASAAMVLINLTGLLGFVHPEVSFYGAASAKLALWTLVHLAMIGGAGERWASGEAPLRALTFSAVKAA